MSPLRRFRKGPSYSPNRIVSQSATLKEWYVQGCIRAKHKTYIPLDDHWVMQTTSGVSLFASLTRWNSFRFWPSLVCSDFPTNQTFHQFHDLYTELDLHRIMSGFHGAFATGVASQQGTLTLPDTWFRPPFWDLPVLQLLRQNSSNLPCLYSTFHLEYPLVLSRFCFVDKDHRRRPGEWFIKIHILETILHQIWTEVQSTTLRTFQTFNEACDICNPVPILLKWFQDF